MTARRAARAQRDDERHCQCRDTHPGAAVLAEALAGRSYLVGDRFTIADVVAGGVLESARSFDLFPAAPVLQAYLERLDARPAKQRAFAE